MLNNSSPGRPAVPPIGARFDDWTVAGVPFRRGSSTYIAVNCRCGTPATVQLASLKGGRTRRCRPCAAKRKYLAGTRHYTCPRCGEKFTSGSVRPPTVCPACRPDHQRELNRDYMRQRGRVYAAEIAHRHRGKRFGLSPAEYDQRLQEQDGRCAVCETEPSDGGRRLSIDHDHSCCAHHLSAGRPTCGKCTRSFLCDGCNLGGGIVDNIDLLLRKVAYLRAWAEIHAGRADRSALGEIRCMPGGWR